MWPLFVNDHIRVLLLLCSKAGYKARKEEGFKFKACQDEHLSCMVYNNNKYQWIIIT